MKLLLVDNLVMPAEGSLALLDVHPHLGLLSLAAVAGADGHDVGIYDPKRQIRSGALSYDSDLYQRAADELLGERPDAVGFTTLGCSFLFALNVAALIKRREPDLPILLGGPHATMLHRPILERFDAFDVIVRYEAEETLPAVLGHMDSRRFEHIPGVSWRSSPGGSVLTSPGKPSIDDLDRLPFLDYEHYPVADLGLDLMRIEAGRGCPFTCTFCSTASFFQRRFRLKSAPRLVTELDRLHERYGQTEFKLDHDLFTVNRAKVLEFCEAVAGRGYRWRASARVDCVDREMLERMAASGCAGLYFGVETGSARMQRISQKRLDLTLVEPTLSMAEQLGIEATASFITGYPEELAGDQADTLDLLGRCFGATCLPQLHVLAPEPGTPLFEELGERLEYDGYAGPYNALLVGKGDEQLVTDHRAVFSTYHYYPSVLPRSDHVLAVELVDVLRRLGPTVLAYLLRAFDGRLSRLVFELRAFAISSGREVSDGSLLQEFVEGKFGPGHHMASLTRYALHADRLRSESQPGRDAGPVEPFSIHRRYRLNDRVSLLEDMHDCAALLDAIPAGAEQARLVEDSAVGERGVCLLKPSGNTVTGYHLDPASDVILRLFDQPRSCAEVSALLAHLEDVPAPVPEFFSPLVDAGILVSAEG